MLKEYVVGMESGMNVISILAGSGSKIGKGKKTMSWVYNFFLAIPVTNLFLALLPLRKIARGKNWKKI